MVKKIARDFPGTTGSLIDQSTKIETYLPSRKAAFQHVFPTVFSDGFFSTLADRVSKARSMPSDQALREDLSYKTASLDEIDRRFDDLYLFITLCAEAAFPKDQTLQAKFGVDRKAEITASAASLHKYLIDFASIWADHGQAMLDAACPASMPSDIAQLEKDLTDLKAAQGSVKDDRHNSAADRVDNLNQIWDMLLKLEHYAPAVFGKGSADTALFMLDRPSTPPKPVEPTPVSKG